MAGLESKIRDKWGNKKYNRYVRVTLLIFPNLVFREFETSPSVIYLFDIGVGNFFLLN